MDTQKSSKHALQEFIVAHTVRGDCQCGKCFDVPEHSEQPKGHTANLVFFKVAMTGAPDAERLKTLVKESVEGSFNRVNIFDGQEHSYLELGSWIGDQGYALRLMGLGNLLGLWQLLTPITMLKLEETNPLCQQMASMGLISIQAKKE